MLVPSYMSFLRLIYHLLLGMCFALIGTLLGLKFLGTQYNADKVYNKLKGMIDAQPTLRFTIIGVILALSFATNFCFSHLQGISMEPNFWEGQLVLVRHHNYRLKRGDVVILELDGKTDILKRLIGLPGDKIHMPSTGGIIVNWKMLDESGYQSEIMKNENEIDITVPPNEFFVLGDNREESYDSREHGGFERNKILGKVIFNLGTPPEFIMDLWHSLK